MRLWPVWEGVNVTLHEPALRVHVVELNVPVLLLVNVTVPVGVTAPAPEASDTVAVHVDAEPLLTEAGEQDTVVVLARIVDATVNDPLLPV
jgi:hypothetical protein